MSDYGTDVLAWSAEQAALLRRRAAGELVNDSALDWPNIAEEIESVGQSERSALQSHIGTVARASDQASSLAGDRSPERVEDHCAECTRVASKRH